MIMFLQSTLPDLDIQSLPSWRNKDTLVNVCLGWRSGSGDGSWNDGRVDVEAGKSLGAVNEGVQERKEGGGGDRRRDEMSAFNTLRTTSLPVARSLQLMEQPKTAGSSLENHSTRLLRSSSRHH